MFDDEFNDWKGIDSWLPAIARALWGAEKNSRASEPKQRNVTDFAPLEVLAESCRVRLHNLPSRYQKGGVSDSSVLKL